jgi:hypothetical protein
MRRLALPFALAVLLATPARADVPPDHPETCTESKRGGSGCEMCGANHTDWTACAKHYEGTNLEHVCSSQGASVWEELWCPPGVGHEAKGCSAAPVSMLALVGLVMRRRRAGSRSEPRS